MKEDLSEDALERCIEQLQQMSIDRAKAIGFRPTVLLVRQEFYIEAMKLMLPWQKNRSTYLRRRRGY